MLFAFFGFNSPQFLFAQAQFRAPNVPAARTIGGQLISHPIRIQDQGPKLAPIVRAPQTDRATSLTSQEEYKFSTPTGRFSEQVPDGFQIGASENQSGGYPASQYYGSQPGVQVDLDQLGSQLQNGQFQSGQFQSGQFQNGQFIDEQLQDGQFENGQYQNEQDLGGGFLPNNYGQGQTQQSFSPYNYGQKTEDYSESIPLLNEYTRGGMQLGQDSGEDQISEELPPDLGEMEDLSAQDRAGGREVVVENYPDGKPKIIREMIQDEKGNFFNDGKWTVKKPNGQIAAQGTYKKNVMQGTWFREHAADSGGLFRTKPFNLFQGPFISYAEFKNGKLDGMWTISDQGRRKIFEVPYKNGQRHGTATWWYPDNGKMRQATFKNGVIDGEVIDWNESEQKTRVDRYVDGRKIILNTTFYRGKIKNSQEYFLDAKLEPDTEDNWWDAQPTPYLPTGVRAQDGPSMAWYENGQPKKRGQYDEDKPIGQFVWWHSNGNKKIVGMYSKGKKNGRWTWWYANGMKQYDGQYKNDEPNGVWRSWSNTGKLLKKENLSKNAQPNETDPDSKSIIGPITTDGEKTNPSTDSDPEQSAEQTAESNDDSNSVTNPETSNPANQTPTEANPASASEGEIGELPVPKPHDFGTPEDSVGSSTPAIQPNGEQEVGGLPKMPN